MAQDSGIEWTTHTFNPWWGCTRVSPGCENCYAERLAPRRHVIWGPRGTRKQNADAYWDDPLVWDRKAKRLGVRHRVFCASMSDVFEDRAELEASRQRLWALIGATPHLDWLLLTKRPENIGRMAPWSSRWPANIWLGTSVENQEYADKRIPLLLQHPAVVRFLSVEPLLGSVDLAPYLGSNPGVDWVIGGGESGPGKVRTMELSWIRAIRDQCEAAGTAFLFKQWGEYGPEDRGKNVAEDGTVLVPLGKKTAGRLLDGRTWDQYPTPRTALSPVVQGLLDPLSPSRSAGQNNEHPPQSSDLPGGDAITGVSHGPGDGSRAIQDQPPHYHAPSTPLPPTMTPTDADPANSDKSVLQELEIDRLEPHPSNPRLGYDRDVIGALVSEMEQAGKFDRAHAIRVRPKEQGRFQIIDGHQRVMAAREAKLARVWAWVVEMNDATALVRLGSGNNQASFSPLEKALLSWEVVPAQGVKDGGLQAFAVAVGLKPPNLTKYRKGAKVFREVWKGDLASDENIRGRLRDKADALADISKAPKEEWPELVRRCANENWTAKKAQEEVKRVLAKSTPQVADSAKTKPPRNAQPVAFGEPIVLKDNKPLLVRLPGRLVTIKLVKDARGHVTGVEVNKPRERQAKEKKTPSAKGKKTLPAKSRSGSSRKRKKK